MSLVDKLRFAIYCQVVVTYGLTVVNLYVLPLVVRVSPISFFVLVNQRIELVLVDLKSYLERPSEEEVSQLNLFKLIVHQLSFLNLSWLQVHEDDIQEVLVSVVVPREVVPFFICEVVPNLEKLAKDLPEVIEQEAGEDLVTLRPIQLHHEITVVLAEGVG